MQKFCWSILIAFLLCHCQGPLKGEKQSDGGTTAPKNNSTGTVADVIKVTTTGTSGAYNFSVTITSPDKGCAQYANWWEVIAEDGKLIYRRILLHSHVSEQPFERSGGSVNIKADQIVWVRAHMHPGGYGGKVFKGSVSSGFTSAKPTKDFAATLATQEPLPKDCAF